MISTFEITFEITFECFVLEYQKRNRYKIRSKYKKWHLLQVTKSYQSQSNFTPACITSKKRTFKKKKLNNEHGKKFHGSEFPFTSFFSFFRKNLYPETPLLFSFYFLTSPTSTYCHCYRGKKQSTASAYHCFCFTKEFSFSVLTLVSAWVITQTLV